MRNFVLGIIVTLAVLIGGALAFLMLGFMPTSANTNPSTIERSVAMHAMDASMDRAAPHINNPVPPTDGNLIEGMKLYTMNCALCHGTLDDKPSPLEHAMYPPPPQVILAPLDDPEWHVYYAVRTGVRYTGMPAWEKVLSDQDMWKIAAFLTRIEKLPPNVQEYWKKSFNASPPGPGAAEKGDHDND